MSKNGDQPLLTAVSSLSLNLTSSTVSSPTTAATQTSAAAANPYSTPAAATTTSFSPTPDDEGVWEDFCRRVNASPPKCINKALDQVKREANVILKRSHLKQEDGSFYTWDSLQDYQQAGMAFILNEGIAECFPPGHDKNGRIAHGVLGINKIENGEISIHGEDICRDLRQFIRKGSDHVNSNGSWSTNFGLEQYTQFRDNHKELWGNDSEREVESCTIFSLNFQVEPILQFQAEFSMVCALVGGVNTSGAAASSASTLSTVAEPRNQGPKPSWMKLQLLKRRKKSNRNTVSGDPDSQPAAKSALPRVTVSAHGNEIEAKAGHCKLNIGRYMRKELTAKQKYETIFEGRGFVFDDVLTGILLTSNACKLTGGFLGQVEIGEKETVELIFILVKKHLQYGALCARIRLFEGYETKTMCVKEQSNMGFINAFHFVTIIGVSRTRDDQQGEVMFLVHDSLQDQPFKNISLELLRAMQSTNHLTYIRDNTGIKMPDESAFDLKPEVIVTAGSLQLKRSDDPRCKDAPLSEEEQKELEKKREGLAALVDPNYRPQWLRGPESYADS